MWIKTVKKGSRTYYELFQEHKFVMHIGNAEALRVFRRMEKHETWHSA